MKSVKRTKRFSLALLAAVFAAYSFSGCAAAVGFDKGNTDMITDRNADYTAVKNDGAEEPWTSGQSGETAAETSDDVQAGESEMQEPEKTQIRRYLRTDNTKYQKETQKIYITANGDEDDWVGVYAESDETFSSPVAEYKVSEEGMAGIRYTIPASELSAGEYNVVLFAGEGTASPLLQTKISVVEYGVETNKQEYFQNEEIVVMPFGPLDSWVGMFPAEAELTKENCLGSFVINEKFGSGLGYILQQSAGVSAMLAKGDYKIVVFSERENYESDMAQTTITVVGGEVEEAAPPTAAMFNLDILDRGRASGTVTLAFNQNRFNASEVIAYWADDNGILEEFTSFGAQRVTGLSMRYYALENVLIPAGATNIRFYGKNVNGQGNAYYRLNLPQGCNYQEGEVLSEFALLSDIHINAEQQEKGNTANQDNFRKALEDIVTVSPDSDGVFIVGDVADDGREASWNLTEEIAESVEGLPKVYYMLGNHDLYNAGYEEVIKPYQKLMGLTDKVYYEAETSGYHHFILGSQQADGDAVSAYLFDDQLDWLEERLDAVTKEDPNKPVFVYLHQPMTDTTKGTLPGQGWAHIKVGEPRLKQILADHPQAFFINGHNHSDLNSYRVTYFASSEQPNNIVQTGGTAYLSDTFGSSLGHQGWYVRVYENEVVFLGREFSDGKWMPAACLIFTI